MRRFTDVATAEREGRLMTESMMEVGHVRLMIVDDHAVLRRGVVASLSEFEDIEVVAEAGSGEEFLAVCQVVMPHVALIDLMMPGMGGVAAIQALHDIAPDVQMIAFTSFREDALVEEALRAGAISYLLKDIAPDELAKAIRLASQGMPVLAPAATQSLVHALAQRHPKLGFDLTERERQVLTLLAEGHSNQIIAERLVITSATVKFHTRSIRHKLGTTSRTETAILALQNHLIQAS
jgi:NarL family two-component system response regulator LiaR